MTAGGEWLLANGLGGYAMGPEDGPPTRGYHGWLIAATRPPEGRRLLVGPIETRLEVDAVSVRLDRLEIAPGRIQGDPLAWLTGHEAGVRVRNVEALGVSLELRAAMVHDANATVLRWRRLDADPRRRVRLELVPLLACRDHHGSAGPFGTGEPAPADEPVAVDVRSSDGDGPAVDVSWGPGRPALRMAASTGVVWRADRRVRVHLREAAARGTIADETLLAVAAFSAALAPGGELAMVLGTETGSIAAIPDPRRAGEALRAAGTRADGLLAAARVPPVDARTAALVLAADRFLVRRPAGPGATAGPAADPGRTIIAGYPWFGDWGRDTMISLPGLALASGRHEEAAGILRTWAGLVRDGLLPNHFPEAGGEPAYHSVDAPLWFIHAIGEHEAATGDPSLARALRPAVEAILAAYRDGTRFGIGVDPADGLVRAGEGDVQPTWMDATVAGVPVTPRHGKPVEIQALWVNALRRAAGWARRAGEDGVAARHNDGASRAESAFRARFPRPETGWLADVVDGPSGDDASLRPNQLLALSLPHPLVDAGFGRRILDAVERHLVVPGGVRSLAPFESGYRARFQGPAEVRDAAYHQGTAWTWPLGPWIDSVARYRGEDAARVALDDALAALDPDVTGAIPEVLEPEPPHEARGCAWQAWGVAELLRVRRRLLG
ncbi:MAG: amylo-alpha-1,6-glucosidase [Chloroflexota bacterium]